MTLVATRCPQCGDYDLHELIWLRDDPPPDPLTWRQTLRAKCKTCEYLFMQEVSVRTLPPETQHVG